MILLYSATATLSVVFAFLAVYSRDLFNSALYLGASSILLATTFFILQAPDIAITEAAVGAALSTFLIIMTLSKTEREE